MKSMTVLAPTGALGYGFDLKAFERGMGLKPDVIAVDSGTTDNGPYFLGSGVPSKPKIPVKRELEILLQAALSHGIPLIIGSAGGAGGAPHTKWTVDIVREISKERGYHFKMAVISGELDKGYVVEKLKRGWIKDFEAGFQLETKDIEDATRIVAQMGPEPFTAAFEKGAQIIVAGRACDDAVMAAYPIMKGFDPGLSIHMGKILECGAFAAVPFGMDVMLGTLYKDHFVLEPGSLNRICNVYSVGAHSLYERDDPCLQPGPGGTLDIRDCKIEQLDERRVKVSCSKFIPNNEYWIKMEGAKKVGYRNICIGGIRCPTMIERIDPILDDIRKKTENYFAGITNYQLFFHVYGRNGVMGKLEPNKKIKSHELGIVTEVIAPTKELAATILFVTTGMMLHYSYEGQKNTAGNMAFLYSPRETDVGEVFVFSIYHLLRVEDPCNPFPIEIMEV